VSNREDSCGNAKNGEFRCFSRFYLDSLLTTEQCAVWFKVSEGQLSNLVVSGVIPAIDLNGRVRRFHARSVLLKLGACGNCLVIPEQQYFLDSMLTTEELASWFQLSVRSIRAFVEGKKLHVMAPNQRFWRFHPRSVLHQLGVKTEALPIQLARAA
jgi:hypothetical protein